MIQKTGFPRIKRWSCFRNTRNRIFVFLFIFLCLHWHVYINVRESVKITIKTQEKTAVNWLWSFTLSTITTVMWHWKEKRKDTSAILFYISEPWKCNLQAIHCHCQGSNILFQVPHVFSWIVIERSENMKEKKKQREKERERISSNVNSKNFHSMKRRKAKRLYFLVKKLN
jgi:hypothetical protein